MSDRIFPTRNSVVNKVVSNDPLTIVEPLSNMKDPDQLQTNPPELLISEYIPEGEIPAKLDLEKVHSSENIDPSITPQIPTYLGSKNFAFIGGSMLMAFAIVSALVPGLESQLRPLAVTESSGWFLGHFPLNIILKSILFVIGLGGFSASNKLASSINWSRFVFIVMGSFAVMGMIYPLSTFFGYIPLYGSNIFLNGAYSITGAYFAYYSNPKNATRTDY